MVNGEKLIKRWLLSIIAAFRPVKRIDPASLPVNLLKRILIVKQHDQLGDLLVTTPAIRAVRKKFPHAYIAVVAREYTAPMIWDNPNVDSIVVFREQFKKWNLQYARTFWQLLRSDGGFDCAIVMNSVSRSLSSDLIAVVSKAKYIIGPDHLSLDPEIPEKIYNVVTRRSKVPQLEIEHYLDIVRAIGVRPDGMEYDLELSEEENGEAEKLLYELGIQNVNKLIGIHLGALNKEKRLPLDMLAKTISWVKVHYDCRVLLLIGPDERQLREQLLSRIDRKAVVLVPVVPIRVASAIIKKLDVLLCNDTGTMHIASSLRVPTVTFHSISDPLQWKPPHERHIGLRAGDHKITSIKIEMITEAIDRQMQSLGIPKKSP